MKNNYFLILGLFLFTSACRFTTFTPANYLGKSILDFENKKVLIMDVDSNLKYSKQEQYAQNLYEEIKKCPYTEALDMTAFFNQYQIGFIAAKTIEAQLALLAEYTNVDYVLLPYAKIRSNEVGSLNTHEGFIGLKTNASVAGIEAYSVEKQSMVKYIEYFGAVDNAGISDFDLELYQSANKIAEKSYRLAMKDFLQYLKCKSN